ncbi:MAG TPA: NADH-specific enoyl-ACP reductase, partial [Sulfitobacter sp.]|nr:NADH-specific enoyl-ACP reductase [Sulfitobacter sp.]
MANDLMAGKRGLIMGLANDKSIAWGIARTLADAGAELAFSYQGDALKKRVDPLAAQLGSDLVLPCDVGSEESIDALFTALGERWDGIDFIVHAIGFSDKNELRGRYVDTSRANFQRSLDISCFSFTDVCKRASALMPDVGSLLTLTYYGAERVMPHYNVMGVA